MARYNSVNSTNSVGAGSTISSPFSGLLTTIPSAGTVAIPNPVLYTGTTQVFYNAAPSGNVILTTPSGVFNGPGASGTGSFTLPFGSIVTLISDGTNYITQDWIGGPVTATSLTASGAVTFNPANASISLQPTGTGTITISPATTGTIDSMNIGATTQGTGKFSSLIATGNLSTTANTAATLGTTGTGALQVSGGASVAGILNVGSQTVLAGNVGIGTSTSSLTATLHIVQSADTSDGGIKVFGSGGSSLRGNLYYNGSQQFIIYGASAPGGGDTNTLQFATGGVTPLIRMSITRDGLVAIGTNTPVVSLDMGSRTDAIILPVGTTAQRPTGAAGMMRYNTTTGYIEYFYPTTSSWVGIGQFSATSSGTVIASNSGLLNGYIVHVFTTSGTFIVNAGSKSVNYLIVGGGGGGGWDVGGGGGGGGLLQSTVTVAPGTYSVTVGAGGPSYTSGGQVATYENGGNSSFNAVGTTAIGGGGGGNWSGQPGASGGSGGGNTSNLAGFASGTVGQGNNGGSGANNTSNANEYSGASGGGGAGAAGGNGTASGWTANSSTFGYGGNGLYFAILSQLGYGSPAGWFGGGGGSGSDGGSFYGIGGNGGGSVGGNNRVNAPANTGGGGGGAGSASNVQGGLVNNQGSLGGSGIVIIWYTP
jgi:hypothetical protein